MLVERKNIQYAKAACIAGLASIAIYAFVRHFVMSQRADVSTLILNVALFAAIGGVLIYLSKKERDLEHREPSGD